MHDIDKAVPDDDFDERVFGRGDEQVEKTNACGYQSNIKATNMAGRAKQFIPFAALRGFCEMVEEVAHSHDNIEPH